MRRTLLAAASAASGLLVVLGMTSSAQAYPIETHKGYASSSAYGYGAYEVDTNGYGFIYAMDTNADGYRIVSSVYNDTQGRRVAYVEDANGSSNGSGAAFYDYGGHAGDSMHFVTCRQNGSSGTPFNCKTTYFTLPY
ncbi:hypothetical protein MUU72_15205 [Streptomyces sp. RS10V-4]|uniref:hypothetical protein n=1 Tax=Streptomyces rhizoryzae TaxID=2932493 RepID=UPI002005F32F|nr:hypothetical protein [Streptomyces rhizoryzae]MCK7624433.1 hypothetical protein [Streptomyces rhizoryzae]